MATATATKTEYPKIETIYDRNPENMRHVVMGKLREPEYGLVDRWLVTEKIHGTNVRVIYEDGLIRIGGKTDNAQMPLFLLDVLRDLVTVEQLAAIWPSSEEEVEPEPGPTAAEHNAELRGTTLQVDPRVVLYGEGYGAKLQKGGGNYRSDHSFRLFDVCVWGSDGEGNEKRWWLNWPDVADVAQKLGIETVPVLAENATTEEALGFVLQNSVVAKLEGSVAIAHEGIVCRTEPLLFTRRGRRLIWKLKGSDLPE